MISDALLQEIQSAFSAAFMMSGPILIVSLLIATALGILQAAMQLQEQTIPQIVKIVSLSLMLAVGGAALASPLVEFTRHVFTRFPMIVR